MDYHNGQAFTTKERDNDPWTYKPSNNNCGLFRQGAWWYKSCAYSNLNGVYIEVGRTNMTEITWVTSKGNQYSMKSSSMMLRRL